MDGEFFTFSVNDRQLSMVLSRLSELGWEWDLSRGMGIGLGVSLKTGTGLGLGLGLEVATVECSNGEWTRTLSGAVGPLLLSSPAKENGTFPLTMGDPEWGRLGLPDEWLRLSGISVSKLIG